MVVWSKTRGRHLGGDEAVPDQAVELELVLGQVFGHIVRAVFHGSGTNGFVRILRFLLGLVYVGGIGQELGTELNRDVGARFLQSVLGHARGIRAHVGDEADRALFAEFDTFVEPLRQDHGALDAEAQLARGFLLQRGSDEGGYRIAALFAGADGFDDVLRAIELRERVIGGGLARELRRLVVLLDQVRVQRRRFAGCQGGVDGPVLVLDERDDFAFALHDDAQGHGLDPAGGEAPADFVPQQGRNLVTHQTIENAAGLLRVHQLFVDHAGVLKCFLNGVLGDLVEHHPVDVRPAILLALQFLLQMKTDGFAFAVGVGGQVNGFDALGGLFQLADEFTFALDDFIARLETVLHIHGQIFLGEILNMTQRSFDNVLLAQIFIDGFRLDWRFHDYKSFRHNKTSTTSIRYPRGYHTFTKFFPGSCLTRPSISNSKSAAISSEAELSSTI